MIIQLDSAITINDKHELQQTLTRFGFKATEVTTQSGAFLVVTGGKQDFDLRRIGHLRGVRDVHRVLDPYKLVSHSWKVHPTTVDLGGGAAIDRRSLAIMSGPCSIEGPEQIESTLLHLRSNNVRIMRGGAFKPRTSPYSFRGLGLDGLRLFSSLAKQHGVKIISEVLEIAQIEQMYPYVDIYQVGTRNTQNFNLLHELGKVDKPVLIKRGMSGTLEELLQSAEYVYASGNERLILCERGIRTFERAYRNTLDLNSVPVLKEKTHLPVVVDPSHGVGIRRYIEPMALAAVMAGADGLLLEVHPQPESAASDGQQTLNFEEASRLYERCRTAYEVRAKFG